jgi:predicted GNAT family N-acyltransferase
MLPGFAYYVERVDWQSAAAPLRQVRRLVFVEEQGVPEELEWDEWDARCVHVLARTSTGEPVGTGRLLPDAHIGRMAVLPRWRRQGVASAMLRELLAVARERGDDVVRLNAQTQAIPFYLRFGFAAQGPEFQDAGIPHRLMVLRLR